MADKHENIEDFVRKVIDQSEAQIQFNESHWQQMESMLDAELPVGTNPGAGYYYFSNAISLLVGVVFIWAWLFGPQQQAIQTVTIPDTKAVSELSSSQEASPEVSSISATTEEQLATNEQLEGAKDEVQIASTGVDLQSTNNEISTSAEKESQSVTSESSDVADSNNISGESNESSALSKPINESLNNERVEVVEDQKANDPNPSTASESTFQSQEEIDDDASKESIISLVDEEESVIRGVVSPTRKPISLEGALPDLPDQLTKVAIQDPDGGAYEVDNSPILKRSVRGSYSRFSVGVSLAPDLSSNEIFRYNRLGRDLGIVLDYWVTPRLAVSVGAFNTSKRYLVGGEEYNPPAGFWGNITNGELPAKIDADCQVLDIPVNLKYRLLTRPNLNIYASAGVSSYIMLREDYQYELDNGWQSEWGTRNENQHFFGVGNFQVHFERRFGRHLAVEVAPFFKAPLTSFGHGNIRFHSMGSFFTLRKYFLNK